VGKTFGGLVFTLLPSPQSRWKSFTAGWTVQAFSLVGLLFLGVQYHGNLVLPEDDRVTTLVSYEPLVIQEQKQPFVPTAPPKPAASKPVLETKTTVAPLIVNRQIRAVPEHRLPEPERPAPELKVESKMPSLPATPTQKVVAVGTFSTSTSLAPTVSKPATAVQTGGFGDPNGIPSSDHHGVANISAKGGFDLPGGSGHGNGSGGANPGVVMSSGFGNGAIDANGSVGSHSKPASHEPSSGVNAPVEITFKPKPDYTDEGRRQKINGEVRLEVLFKSDGQIQVIRVVQGLGYGLDEEAVKVAEQIKFKPALHEGQPIDSTAQVHIIFQLIS
jgi:TonB family protein